MIFYRLTFLVLISFSSFAQSDWQFKADSLSDCGYFKEEVFFRKKILDAAPKNSSQFKIAKVLFDIAEMNVLEKMLAYDKASFKNKEILKYYESFSNTEKKQVEVDIDRLKANELISEKKFDEAIVLFKHALKKVPAKSIKAAELYLNIGQTYESSNNYFQAITNLKKAIEGFEKNGWGNHYATALAYNDLAFSYDYANTEKEMIPTFEKALQIWSIYYAADASIVAVAYNDAIFAAIEYGDRKKASEYQKRFDAYMEQYLNPKNRKNYKDHNPYDDYHARAMYHLSSLRYYDMNFDEAKIMFHLKSQEQLYAVAPKEWVEKEKGVLLSSYDSASYSFYNNEQSSKALAYNKIMEDLANNDFYKMKASANRAMLYYYKFDYGQSLIHTQKALEYLEILGYKSSYLTLLILKAENLANMGRIKEAKATVKEVYTTQFDKETAVEKIKIKDFGEISNASYINIFIHSGMAYRRIYEKTGKSKSDLKILKNFYGLAADMFKGYYQKGYFNPALERQLNNIKEGLMFSALQTPNDKVYLADCINKIEDMSSQHLWKQFLSKYSNNLNLSKQLINKRNETVIELSYLAQKKEKIQKETEREKLLNASLTSIDKEIASKYPNYDRFQAIDFKVQNLQKNLETTRTIVKYYVTDSSVFACNIGQNSLDLKYLGQRKKVEKLSKTYHEQISKIDFGYKAISKVLYDFFLKPLNLPMQNSVIFIPENFLNFCPFETLVDGKDLPFAVNHIVSYSNSLKFSQKLFSEKNTSYDNFLTGFAPKYQDGIGVTRASNGQLIYTGAELNSIADIFRNSTLFISENATKTNFLKSLGSSNVHHLAMHSILDDKDYEYSSLVFQNNEKMHFFELYALNFPSEMVVLSACNTGVGEYLNGEGLMSISRALNYAGVQSTVNSLWQVPDKETSELMSYFYEFLNEGIAKDLALVKAKRKFISKNPLKNHPYYWSGFIINGDIKPLSPQSYWWLYGLGILSISALAIGFFYFRKKQTSQFV
ncbi:CHAT domain-containing protein [Lacihabitans sp. LS3-19]|uniref:CHAT domain-containing protein n=1 Tax=Lacihabitans sp. LS3-19 TaxID=2487335 RepID=UPI0020CCF0E3|nr:CHAT domain-containing protein [Lacihabitans sp. LS3-19]MCP9770779.1 CHAT domain-containing protein [Lacihabitans sp. LS3-19]